MKLTQSRLKQIIKEELQNLLEADVQQVGDWHIDFDKKGFLYAKKENPSQGRTGGGLEKFLISPDGVLSGLNAAKVDDLMQIIQMWKQTRGNK
jgi:hypothetical protein